MAETEKLKKELKALTRQTQVGVKLKKLKNPLGIGPSTGVGRRKPKGGGNIESPVTETDYSAREYWTNTKTVTSVDGLLSFTYKPIKKIVSEDAGGNEVIFIYADPSA